METYTRRTVIGGIAAGLAATGGCLGVITGREPLTFAADPARVSERTLEETGYELVRQRSPTVTREFTVGGRTRSVEVTNQLALYEKAVDIGPAGSQKAGLFGLFTTPQIEMGGRAFNPIKELSMRDLLERFESRYEGVGVGQKVGSASVSTLGTSVTVEKYAGTATIQGMEIDIYLHVTRFKHDEDFVVAIGGYPQRVSDEGGTIHSLIANITH